MQLQLEQLGYQQTAIESVIKVFEGTAKNNFDNATFNNVRRNVFKLSDDTFLQNIKSAAEANLISDEAAKFIDSRDLTVEMETGTGKTLVYLKTIYELHQTYGFTKFIILVPLVAIKEGVLASLKTFEKQLKEIYGFTPDYFEYDSKKLTKVKGFAEEQHLQIMIMTTGAIVGDDKIINRSQREDLFDNKPFIEVIAETNPILIMDEPQMMEGDKTKEAIQNLKPLCKIRYSATHKDTRNLIYRLTPFDSYEQNLVKKIEVLTVTEKNDEASLKIEFSNVQTGRGDPKVKLKAWTFLASGKCEFKDTAWLKVGDNLADKTNNSSYQKYEISRIEKRLLGGGKWRVHFSNGTEIVEGQMSGNLENIWSLQLEWLIRRHFEKSVALKDKGIKCLSLIFINRVANYISDNPVIKNIFIAKYRAIYAEFNGGQQPTDEFIESLQGFYFAKTGKDEYTDNENSMQKNREIYDLILRKKDELLSLDNPVQFIFSHSALGVGWDNPNVFNIATLSNTFSEIKKRQEIGRGLRICVNQDGKRVYDADDVTEENRINRLTVVPNETYQTFVTEYQAELKDEFGAGEKAPRLTHTHKGKPANEIKFSRSKDAEINRAFKEFWEKISRKTDYLVSFDDETIINEASAKINELTISESVYDVSLYKVEGIAEDEVTDEFFGSESYKSKTVFSPLDLLEELSEQTQIAYPTLFKIVGKIKNHAEWIKNPLIFVQKAAAIIKNVELDVMIRGLSYQIKDERFPFEFDDFVKNLDDADVAETPHKGIFDKFEIDSKVEKDFAETADNFNEVVCLLKLPSYYKIKTPIGNYEPDFGLVLKRKRLKKGEDCGEFYFVVETKGTNDLEDKKALKESEKYKILCAMRHFEALGIDYVAPVKDFGYFQGQYEDKARRIIEPC